MESLTTTRSTASQGHSLNPPLTRRPPFATLNSTCIDRTAHEIPSWRRRAATTGQAAPFTELLTFETPALLPPPCHCSTLALPTASISANTPTQNTGGEKQPQISAASKETVQSPITNPAKQANSQPRETETTPINITPPKRNPRRDAP